MDILNYDTFKGLDTIHTLARIDDNRQAVLKNFDLTEQGYIKKRTGVRRLGEIADGGALRILGRFKTASLDRIITYNQADGDLDYTDLDGAALTQISASAGSDVEWMAQYAGRIYICRSSSAPATYDGTTFSTMTSKTSCTMNLFYKDREWLINTASSTPDTLRYSNIAGSGGTDFDNANHPSLNAIIIGRNDGQWLSSMAVYNDQLYIFKNNSTWVLFTDTNTPADWQLRNIEPSIGCIARASVHVHENLLYFEAQDGVYRTDGTTFEEISAPIRDIFLSRPVDKSTTYEDAAIIYEDRYILQINNLDGDNARITLVYNIKVGGWSVYEWGHQDISPNSFLVVPDRSPESLYFGSASPLPVPDAEVIYENNFDTNITSGLEAPPFDTPDAPTGGSTTPFINQSLGYGRFQTSNLGSPRWARIKLTDILPADYECRFDLRISPTPPPGGSQNGMRAISFRSPNGNWKSSIVNFWDPVIVGDGWAVKHYFGGDGSTQQIGLSKIASEVETFVQTENFAFSATDHTAHCILRLEADNIKFKIWLVGQSEPGSWLFDETDAHEETSRRFQIGCRSEAASPSSNFQIDNLVFYTIASTPAAPGYLFKFGAEVYTDEVDEEYNYETVVRSKFLDFGEPGKWKHMRSSTLDYNSQGPSSVGWAKETSMTENVPASTNVAAASVTESTGRALRQVRPAGHFRSVGWEHRSLHDVSLFLYALSMGVIERPQVGRPIG